VAESIYLHGSEDVSRAASTMSRAAEQMQNAASSFSHTMEQHQRFMDDWLGRLQATIEEARQK
jgi:Flp pilus assembly protein TadG